MFQEEFAEALAVNANSDFVEHFFSLIDADRNGYISFREFLNAVVLFSKGAYVVDRKSRVDASFFCGEPEVMYH